MGISLELYRARIGSFNNRCRVKDSAQKPDLDPRLSSTSTSSAQIPPPLVIPLIRLTWKQSSLGLLLIIITFLCHNQLLLRSGVESHPGPLDNDVVRDIIAGLCVDAPSDQVRDTLRNYDCTLDLKQNKTKYKKTNKQELVDTLNFLGVKNQDQRTKPTCVHNLICRIENLLPDTCSICKEDYKVGYLDTPLLSCEDCGQGSHNKCILDKLGVEEAEQESYTPDDASRKINPAGLPGIHYLCGRCSTEHIPSKETGLLRRRAPEAIPGPEAETQEVTQTESQDGQEEGENEASNETPTPKRNDDTGASAKNDSSAKKTCHYYQKGTCRHGVSGKGCSYAHPKPCSKLIKHGNKAPHGCTLSRAQCDKFHPKMCPSSLSRGECITTNCTMRHVTGTKMLHKNVEQDHRSRTKPNTTKKITDATTKKPQSSKSSNTADNLTSSDFLESLRLLKIEMMEAMDVKLATLMSTQTAMQTTPHIPQSRPVEPPTWQQPHPCEIHQQNHCAMNQTHRGCHQNRCAQIGCCKAVLAAHQGC